MSLILPDASFTRGGQAAKTRFSDYQLLSAAASTSLASVHCETLANDSGYLMPGHSLMYIPAMRASSLLSRGEKYLHSLVSNGPEIGMHAFEVLSDTVSLRDGLQQVRPAAGHVAPIL